MLFDKSNPDKRDKCVNEIAFYQKAISNLLRLAPGDLKNHHVIHDNSLKGKEGFNYIRSPSLTVLFKTRPSGSDNWNRYPSASPRFILKNHLNDRSKVFMLEELYYDRARKFNQGLNSRNMKILLHICCAPCAIYPLKTLREAGHDVVGLFFNPNIQPYSEYKKRLDTLTEYAGTVGLNLIFSDEYPMEDFLRNVVFREETRCRYCYHTRLIYAANVAKRGNFEGFTTSLLYSKFQDSDLIETLGKSAAKEKGVPFCCQDFSKGWKEGIDASKALGMYRQQYCGCIYSEKERFYKRPEKKI